MGRPLRILYITELFPDPKTGLGFWGGGERHFYEVARRVARLGHHVTVLTCRFPGQSQSEDVEGMEVRRFGMSRSPKTGGALLAPSKVGAYIAETLGEALRLDSDIIHCNSYYPVIPGRIASTMRGVPMVTTFHDVPDVQTWEEYSGSASWGRLGYLATLASVRLAGDLIVAVSEPARKKLELRGRRDVKVIPNGVDLALLDASNAMKKMAQVLYVGRLVRYKKVGVLILAFREVITKAPEARLVIVGDGPERPALEALASTLPEGTVRFMGTVPSHETVALLFKQSSLFVMPSVVEGEGIALKEGMAAGLPVIAVDAPGSGVPSIVTEGWNGFLLKPDDSHGMAEAMLKIILDSGLRDRMGRNGREFAGRWSWDDVTSRLIGIYRGALGLGQRSDAPHTTIASHAPHVPGASLA